MRAIPNFQSPMTKPLPISNRQTELEPSDRALGVGNWEWVGRWQLGPWALIYCFSYTVIVVTAFPLESRPFVVVVIVLPSADSVTVDFAASRPPILTVVS
jgi:hypothetical protein